MSILNRVYGVRIWTDSNETNSDLGLYLDGALIKSQFRWIEVPCSGLSETWKSGVLAFLPIDEIHQSADFEFGGNMVNSAGCTIRVRNVDQLILRCKEIGISFPGCRVDIIEFVGTNADADSDNADGYSVFTGKIDSVEWDETVLILKASDNLNRRNSTLAKSIESSIYPYASTDVVTNPISVVFGNFLSSEGSPAKLTNIEDVNTILSSDDVLTVVSGYDCSGAFTNNLKQFAIYNNTPVSDSDYDQVFSVIYKIQISDVSIGTIGSPRSIDVSDLVMVVSEDTNVSSGECRQIKRIWQEAGEEGYYINIELHVPFSKTLQIASSGTPAWIEIRRISKKYLADNWEINSFLDINDNAVSDKPEVYAYEGTDNTESSIKRYSLFPEMSHEFGTDDQSIKLVLTSAYIDIDNIASFHIIPVSRVRPCEKSTLADYGFPLYNGNVFDGIFERTADTHKLTGWSNGTIWTVNGDYAIDRKGNTSERIGFSASVAPDKKPWYAMALTVIPPELPEYLKNFDDCALLIDFVQSVDNVPFTSDMRENCGMSVVWRKFLGTGTNHFTYEINYRGGDQSWVFSLPTRYYTTPTAPIVSMIPNDGKFFCDGYRFGSDFSVTKFTGHNRFLSGISTEQQYNAISEIGIVIWRTVDENFSSDSLDLAQCAMAFKKTISNSSDRYSFLKGRIFDDTWNSRRTASDVITSPIDIVEHVRRLGNWSEIYSYGIYGQQYSTGALIKEDDFDDVKTIFETQGPEEDKTISSCRQLTSANEMYIDEITNSICKQFFLSFFVDSSGYERIRYLLSDQTPVATITLDDIIGEIGLIKEPDERFAICTPTIYYNWNYASQKFDSCLQIVNPQSGSGYSADYAPGFSGSGNIESGRSDGEVIWEKCRSLWNRFRSISQIPSDVSECKWIRKYEDAVWYLNNLLEWISKRRTSFTVPYSVGRSWYVSDQVNIQLPHQTDDNVISCCIESISKRKNDGTVQANVIILDEIDTSFYDDIVESPYQDTNVVYDSEQQWQVDRQTYSERGNTGLEDVQNDVT